MVAENETASPEEVPPKALVLAVRIIDTVIGRGSGLLFAGLVLPMVGGLCYEVFARYLFNAPTIWAYDVTYILYGSHFMLGAAYTLYKGSHIRTDMLYEKFTVQWKGIVDASMYLFFSSRGCSSSCLPAGMRQCNRGELASARMPARGARSSIPSKPSCPSPRPS